jgi:lipoyl(octanoyl) transferase
MAPVLRVYMLGLVDFEAALALQRRLVYDVQGNRRDAALILCEHPAVISVGRHGSWKHIDCGIEELRARDLPVRWVNRGGGCVLHLPGQLAIYPVLALDHLHLGVQEYLGRLRATLIAVLKDFGIEAAARLGHPGVWVETRPIAQIGIAVRNWTTYFGAVLNVNPDLHLFRDLQSGIAGCGPTTSVERERQGPLRPSLVRERLIEYLRVELGFDQSLLFSDHASLTRKALCNAVASRS